MSGDETLDRRESRAERLRRLGGRLEWPALAAMLLVLVGGAWWGLPSLLDRADQLSREGSREERPGAARVRLLLPAGSEWLPAEEAARLEATVRSELAGLSTLDRQALPRAARALEATGWFAGPVQLLRPARDEISAVTPLRRPRAFVRAGESDLLIDGEGVLLPWSRPAGTTALGDAIVIRGTSLPPPPRPGDRWEGGDLAEAMRILSLLADRPWREEIAEIEVAAVARGGPTVLRTAGGSAIVWGRTPESAAASEVPAETKLAYLDRLHALQGDLESPPGRRLDLRLDYLAFSLEPGESGVLADRQGP